MGRYATEPQVEDLGSAYWHITRTKDPDDEFAQKQVLTADGWVDYEDTDTLQNYDVIPFVNRQVADDALEMYGLGSLDAQERAYVEFL